MDGRSRRAALLPIERTRHMTRGSNDTVQVRAQRRKDCRWSVRIDLVGWEKGRLEDLISQVFSTRFRDIGWAVSDAMRDADADELA